MLRLSTTYEIRGGVASQSSYDSATVGSGSIVNQVAFRYNDFVQRYESWQSHSGAVNFTSTPKVVSAYADGSSNTIRPTSLTSPNGREIASDYGTSGGMEDCVSRVASLIDDDSTILADYEYLGLGSVVSDICLETGVSYTLIDPTGGTDPDTGDIYGGLDRFSRIKDVRWRKSGSDVSRVQYGYDRASNRTWRRNPSDSSNHYDWLYSYDGLHRLNHADRGTLDSGHTSISGPQFAQCWTLDETGNWAGFRQSDSGTSWSLVQSRISNAANEIGSISNSTGSSWATPSYDPTGNMTNVPQPASPGSAYSATYDAWNRLVQLKSGSQTVQENVYDARNYRVIRKSYTSGSLTETRHAYFSDGWQVLEERVGTSTSPDRHFFWGLRYIDDLILRDRTTSATLDERLYALQDANWNVTAVADDSGTVQERYEYDPYGLTTVLTPSFGSRGTSNYGWETTYAGYRWDAETGLFAVRNRYLNPVLGVWITRDPILLSSIIRINTLLQQGRYWHPLLNRLGSRHDSSVSGAYGYVNLRSLVLVDPSGEQPPPGSGGFFDSLGTSWRGMQDTYSGLIMEYWYDEPKAADDFYKNAYDRGPLGQSKDAPTWCKYGTRGSLAVATTATAAAASMAAFGGAARLAGGGQGQFVYTNWMGQAGNPHFMANTGQGWFHAVGQQGSMRIIGASTAEIPTAGYFNTLTVPLWNPAAAAQFGASGASTTSCLTGAASVLNAGGAGTAIGTSGTIGLGAGAGASWPLFTK